MPTPAPPPTSGQATNSATRHALYGKAPTNKYSLVTPLFWHGMRMGDWWSTLRRNRFAVSGKGIGAALTISMAAAFNSLASVHNRWKHGRRIEQLRLSEPPLFVLGHWRSGTTMLHEMLIRDPRHTYPSTYHCFAPHHFLLSEWWVTPVSAWMLPAKRPMDNVAMGWDRPQEDEFALMNLGQPSPYRCWAFPRHGPVDERYLTLAGLTDRERESWKSALREFTHAVAVKDNRRIVFKSPPHTARVRTLLEVFPDARFVHISRDPLTLFPSTLRLWKSLCDTQGLQWSRDTHDWIMPSVLDNFEAMYEAYDRDRDLIPAGHLTELRYEDLVTDPKEELRRIYSDLSLGDFAEIEPALNDYLADHDRYRTNQYELPADIEATVRERWASYFERFGY